MVSLKEQKIISITFLVISVRKKFYTLKNFLPFKKNLFHLAIYEKNRVSKKRSDLSMTTAIGFLRLLVIREILHFLDLLAKA